MGVTLPREPAFDMTSAIAEMSNMLIVSRISICSKETSSVIGSSFDSYAHWMENKGTLLKHINFLLYLNFPFQTSLVQNKISKPSSYELS